MASTPISADWAPVTGQFDPPIYEYRPDLPGPASAETVMAGLPPVHEIATAPAKEESPLFPNWGATTAAVAPPAEVLPGPVSTGLPPASPVLTLDSNPYEHDTMWPQDTAYEAADGTPAKAHSSKLLVVLLVVVAVAALLYSAFFLL